MGLLLVAVLSPCCGGGGGGGSLGPSVGAVKIVNGAGKSELSWTPVAGASNYRIRYSTTPISKPGQKSFAAGSEGMVTTEGRTAVVLSDLPPGTEYFSVEAVFGAAPGAPAGSNTPLFDPTFTSAAGGPTDFFGWSVAGAGDVNGDGFDDYIVGAVSASPGGRSDAGSAYVYSGADGSLLYQKDGTTAGDAFGTSVCTAGDVNGDGKADFIVGAPFTGASVGTAYVFSGADGSILYQKTNETETVQFGCSVGTAGDVNGDGKADFIVGSFKAYPGNKIDAGSAFVYSGADGSLLYRKDGQNASGSTSADRFGISVGTAGDVDRDGKSDFIVGAIGVDSGPSLNNVGAAYVFSGATGNLLHQIVGTVGNDSDFGNSVGTAGDVNGDGYSDFIVGAHAGPGNGDLSGMVLVYSGVDGAPLYRIPGRANDAQLGQAVATAGDVDGDGYSDFVASENNGMDGRALVFSGRTGTILYQKSGPSGSAFGRAVHTAGDANGDGKADFIAGAAYDNSTAGSAHLFVTSGEIGIIPSETFDPFAADPFAPIRTPKVAPSASKTFTPSGGTAPYAWSIVTNNSGGTGITGAGLYSAGATANVYDTIRVTDSLGRSHDTRVFVTDGVTPAPARVPRPLSLQAILVAPTQIDLVWNDDASNETGFVIESRGATGAWSPLATLGTNSTSHSVTGLDPAIVYFFRVKARNAAGDSLWSPEALERIPAPSGLTATAVSQTQIDLTWVDNSAAEAGFRVQMRTGSDSWTTLSPLAPDTTTFSVTGLTNNTVYFFRVQCFSGTLDSAWSAQATATTPF